MKKAAVLLALAFLTAWTSISLAVPLIQAYNNAAPGAGYDRMIVLDPETVYTGGLVIFNEAVCILSAGAQIDLRNSQILVNPTAMLDICGVVVRNGVNNDAALKYGDVGTRWIDHCTFYDNYDGVRFWDNSDMVLTSNIFSYSSHYGVYTHVDAERWMAFNDAWQNTSGNYKEWCPG